MRRKSLRALFRLIAAPALLLVSLAAAPAVQRPPLLIAYFVPIDREPIPGYVERLDRVMTDVQKFYRDGMNSAGYGPLTFDLERDRDSKLAVHTVKGKLPMRAYGRNDSDKIWAEVESALAANGIDISVRTAVIFQVLLEWTNGVAIEVGPYVGGGSYQAGTAWVYDDALLDPRKLGSREPGGYYGRKCSIGEFNSHYIGGVAHELGHAFGLPHVAGPLSNPRHSLMGDGNHTYGEELRGEGAGTYLHPASAMLLARARPFAAMVDAAREVACDFKTFNTKFTAGQLIIDGSVEPDFAAFGIVAYNDSARIPADYDAQGAVSTISSLGQFTFALGGLQAGEYELRLQICQTNGASTTSAFRYQVDSRGVPDLKPFSQSFFVLKQAMRAMAEGNKARVLELACQLERSPETNAELSRQARHLRGLMQPKVLRSPGAIPASEKEAAVSDLEFVTATVGWARPLRDRVLVENNSTCFLQVGGAFFERGLYAHAPSRFVLDLQGRWARLTTGYGLQDGHDGSVVFVIKGDGRELFRSARTTEHQERKIEVNTAGIRQLELLAEDGGDGPNGDWAVWLSPTLY